MTAAKVSVGGMQTHIHTGTQTHTHEKIYTNTHPHTHTTDLQQYGQVHGRLEPLLSEVQPYLEGGEVIREEGAVAGNGKCLISPWV